MDDQAWANRWREEIRKWSADVELVMLYPEPLGPKVTPYPHERIVARFGTYFMQSSFSWMMALAIDEMAQPMVVPGTAEIGIWGVDMEYGTEYTTQRVGFRHFFEVARLLGIEVSRLASSGLAYEPVPYPLIEDDPLTQKLALRISQTRKVLQETDDLRLKTQQVLSQNEAIYQEIKRMRVNGYDPDARLEQIKREQVGLMKESANLSRKLVSAEAMLEEQQWTQDYLRP